MTKGWAPLSRRTRPQEPSSALAAKRQARPPLGKIRVRLDELARARGWVNRDGRPNRALLQRLTGLSDDALFYLLRYPETVDRIHFSTLVKLCHHLQCQPGDLLVYDRADDADTPLSETYKRDPSAGLEP